jgi:hypothetical protein
MTETRKLKLKEVKGLLPSTLRMVYGWQDVLSNALYDEGDTATISNVDALGSKPEYVGVYKLVRVEKAKRGDK